MLHFPSAILDKHHANASGKSDANFSVDVAIGLRSGCIVEGYPSHICNHIPGSYQVIIVVMH